ncbi:MAG: DUF3179 domain-containing (seleno)protein [Planctomycetota bacterium]
MNEETSAPQDVPEQEPDAEPEESLPEAAPTDFGRHIWLFVLILAVVAVAGLLGILRNRRAPQNVGESPEPTGAGQLQGPPAPGPSGAQPVAPLKVVGRDMEAVLGSPPRSVTPGGPLYRFGRLFDVTRKVPGLQLEEMVRLPGRFAGQLSVMDLTGGASLPVRPARAVGAVPERSRVVVVSAGGESRGYPVAQLERYAGMVDDLGEHGVFVTWDSLTQAARCLQRQVGDRTLEWRDAGLFCRGGALLYDDATGSLWNALSGMALTGPLAGTRARALPAVVWPLDQWREANPEIPMVVPPADRAETAEGYLQNPELPLTPRHYDPAKSSLPAKSFVLGLSPDDEARAYPLASLFDSGLRQLTDSVGGRQVEIHVTSPRTGYATVNERVLDAPVMLWFAWKEAHPDTSLYSPEDRP